MKKKSKQFVLAGMISIFTLSTIPSINVFAAVQSTSKVTTQISNVKDFDDFTSKEWQSFFKVLQNDKNNVNNLEDGRERGTLSLIKKVIKLIVRNVDKIPSKTLRNLINKYLSPISNKLDYLFDASESAITNFITKYTSCSTKNARRIAKVIVWVTENIIF